MSRNPLHIHFQHFSHPVFEFSLLSINRWCSIHSPNPLYCMYFLFSHEISNWQKMYIYHVPILSNILPNCRREANQWTGNKVMFMWLQYRYVKIVNTSNFTHLGGREWNNLHFWISLKYSWTFYSLLSTLLLMPWSQFEPKFWLFTYDNLNQWKTAVYGETGLET